MSRSKWKGFFSHTNLINLGIGKIKTWSRSSIISESLIGTNVQVYNGKLFKSVRITRERVGYKLGEFSFTRVLTERKKKKKTKNTKKKK